MQAQDFQFLNDALNELLEFIRDRITAATDQPEQQIRPIEYLAQPQRTGRRGRPRIEINQEFLQLTLENGGTARLARSNIAASASTIRRRAVRYGIRPPGLPVAQRIQDIDGSIRTVYSGRQPQQIQLDQNQLDQLVHDALTLFPNFGRKMLLAYVKSMGYRVTRKEIVASYLRVNGPPARFGHPRIERRVYKVAGPNSLWHHDGHHSKSQVYTTQTMVDLLFRAHWLQDSNTLLC